MSIDVFELHIQESLTKLEELWERSNAIPTPESELWQRTRELPQQQQQILRESLEELSASIEELQVAAETLKQQNVELITSREQIVAERQYYQELFDLAPDCYIITSQNGTIKEVNQKTTELLGVSAKYLRKKSLAVFIPIAQRQEYYTQLNQIKQGLISEANWQLEITPRKKNTLPVEFKVSAIRDSQGTVINLHWRISPIKPILDAENTVNLTSILIDGLRYPLYNLATQLEEIQTKNQLKEQQINRRRQEMDKEILSLQQVVNNAYIFDRLHKTEDLNPSLVDYTIFIHRLIRQIQEHKNIKQSIVLEYQDSYVGICDVLLLKQTITNILNKSSEYIPVNSEIKVELTKDSSRHLIITIKLSVRDSILEEILENFELLVSNNPINLTNNQDLDLAVVRKCVNLLQGKIELEILDDINMIITVRLPLILVNNN